MRYRELGATGIKVSEIGLGCEGFVGRSAGETRALLEQAVEGGVNCMDMYCPQPELRGNIGAALAGRRERFVIQGHLCSIWERGQYRASRAIEQVRPAFEELYSKLRTDYIDVGMIHYVDSPESWRGIAEGPVMEYLLSLKREGRVRAAGVSSHNPAAALEAVKSGLIDVLMFSVNPCYDLQPGSENCEDLWADGAYSRELVNLDPERQRLYETCERLGVGITVMKAFGGGDLLTDESPAGKALTPAQCLHYALTRPAVASVMAGAHTADELAQALRYETASDGERDYAAAFAGFERISWRGRCVYCGHCAPCPKGISVAEVTKFLNLCKNGVPETVREHYAALSAHAGDCIACGACDGRCPFGVSASDNMAAARRVFGY